MWENTDRPPIPESNIPMGFKEDMVPGYSVKLANDCLRLLKWNVMSVRDYQLQF